MGGHQLSASNYGGHCESQEEAQSCPAPLAAGEHSGRAQRRLELLSRLALPEREKRSRYRRRQLQSWPRGVRCLRESWLGRLAGLFIKTGASDKKSRHGGAERREVDLHVLSVNAGYSVYREVGRRDLEFRDTSK